MMEGEKKNPMRGKEVKYIIYLHWQRETNAFTVIEDTSPSHIDTHTYLYTHTFWLKEHRRKTESREKLIFLKQGGDRERGMEKVMQRKKEKSRGCAE